MRQHNSTDYPPMKAQGAFYLGLTLVVAAAWLAALNLYRTYNLWRVKHPDDWTPQGAFMALATVTMWTIASVGIAAKMLFMLLPWCRICGVEICGIGH
jgi:cytochrome c oxidase subunit I